MEREVNLLTEELKGERNSKKQLTHKYNELNQAYLHQTNQLKQVSKQEKKLIKEKNELSVKCTQLTQVKEQLDKERQFALQNLERQRDWHEKEMARVERQFKDSEKASTDKYKAIFKSVNEELARINSSNEEMSSKYIKQQVDQLASMQKEANDTKETLMSELAVVSRRAKKLQEIISGFEESKGIQ